MSTTEELAEIVSRVREATESLSGDDLRLREIAFSKLLDHELALAPQFNGSRAVSQVSEPMEDPVDSSYETPETRAEAVARYFEIDAEEAQDIFDLSSSSPALALPTSKFASKKAEAVRQIALLVCGSRTALGIETGSAHIREAAEAYGKADGNLMSNLTTYEMIAVRGKKGSQNRLVRMRVIGAEAARELAQQLVSNGG